MKRVILILALCFVVFNQNLYPDTTTVPEADYSNMMPLESEQDEEESVVGDDSLEQDSIGGESFGYQSEMGVSNLRKEIDETGKTTYYVTIDGVEQEISNFQMKTLSDTYKNRLSGFSLDYPSTEDEQTARQDGIEAARATEKTELTDGGLTPSRLEDMFIEGTNPDAVGYSFANSKLTSSSTLEYEDGAETIDLYSNAFGQGLTVNSVSGLNNAGKLKEAFDLVDDMKADLTAKYSSKNISCLISRQLIPKYYCPMVGKTDTKFGGDFNVSEANAKDECEDNCTKEISCLGYNVLSSVDFDIRVDNPLTIYPWNSDTSYFQTDTISDSMQVKKIKYRITVLPSSDWTGTDAEFEEFLATEKPKYRFSLIKRTDSVGNPPLLMVDKQLITITSSITEISIPAYTTTETFVLMFYKPYITENTAVADYVDAAKWAKIDSIKIDNITGEYSGTDLYFCPFSQIVNSESECTGDDGEMIQLMSGSQILNICTDSDHRKGPDVKYGGFYTKETCEQNCIEAQDCLPTYSHYTDLSTDDIYRVDVDCLDDPENTACTKEKCLELIRQDSLDDEIRPVNEWIIYNDDEKKQSVSNKVLQTDVVRPKFDIDSELNVTTTYSELFQTEMKDAAFDYMLDNETYNRIAYRIGEISPRQFAYKTQLINGAQTMQLIIKPESNLYDDNNNYNLYIVMEMDQLYKPVAGVFLIDGQNVQANRDITSDLQLRDKTYAIRTSDSSDWWKVFKKIEYSNYKKVYDILKCPDQEDVVKDADYWDNVEIPDGCGIQRAITWPESVNLSVERDVFYNATTDSFLMYDTSSTAPIYHTQKFSSDTLLSTYLFSEFLHQEIEDMPGGLIRSQESLNHDLNFRKIYNVDYGDTYLRGYVYNYKFYAFYSKTALSYDEVVAQLTEDNIFYEKINPGQYSTTINHDGDINNSIKPFILGDKSISTVNVEMTPYLTEEGQRVFKFMFLHEDSEDVDPFNTN